MKDEKIQAVAEWRDKLGKADMLIFVGFSGVSVPEITSFRKEIRKSEGRFEVVKNTLFQRAVKDFNLPGLTDLLSGPTGVIMFSGQDEVLIVKSIFNFTKDRETKLVFRGAYQNGVPISAAQLSVLAKLPSREAVLARLCGTLNSPISRFLFTLKAVPQKFLFGLKQVGEKNN